MWLLSIFFVALLAPYEQKLFAQGASFGPGDHPFIVTVNDLERHYIVHVPPGYDGTRPVPVVMMFHGGGGNAKAAMAETKWTKKADEAGLLAVFPEGMRPDPTRSAGFKRNPQTWNDGSGLYYAGKRNYDDVGFTNRLLDDLRARFSVDERKIFVTGFSNGGSMAYRLGVELSNRIAAIAPVASSGLRLKEPNMKLDQPVSLCAIHGTEDPRSPLEGGEIKLLDGEIDKKSPVRETILRWAKMNGCPSYPRVILDEDGVKGIVYSSCDEGSEVVFYEIEGMGHTWPGGESLLPERLVGKTTDKMKANDVIWEFFQRHPKAYTDAMAGKG